MLVRQGNKSLLVPSQRSKPGLLGEQSTIQLYFLLCLTAI